MKTLKIGKLAIIAFIFCLGIVPAFSQTRDIVHDLTSFDAVVISGAFQSSITFDQDYAAKITVDDLLEPYVVCYVKGRVLYVEVDEKAIPKEVRKQFRGRNASDPTYRVQIYAPFLTSVTLNDSASFSSSKTIEADDFKMVLSGSASAQGISVIAKKAQIEAAKKVCLNANVKADQIDLSVDGSAKIHLDHACDQMNASVSGTADVAISGECGKKMVVSAGNSSKVLLSGKAEYLDAGGKGTSAKLDASAFPVSNARVSCAGITVLVNASKELELELSKGASVTYSGDPLIKLVSIQSSSVLRK